MEKSISLFSFFFMILLLNLSCDKEKECPKDVTFRTQKDVDRFTSKHSNCTQILGNLTMHGGFGDNITNISGLSQITQIDGDLIIRFNNSLITLEGLDNLTTVSGKVIIEDNNYLESLSALNKLTSIGGSLSLIGSRNNLSRRDDNLISLSGLENLTSTGKGLGIKDHTDLSDLSALSNLTSIGGNLSLTDNESLISLDGLENISPSSITRISIFRCPNLSICDVKSVCDYLADSTNTVSISGNAAGCANQTQVEDACN